MFVRPTTRGKVLCLAAAGSIGVALVNINLTTCMAAACLSSILVSSFLMSLFSLRRIQLVRSPMRDASVGEALAMPLIVRNLSRRGRQVFIIREECPFSDFPVVNAVVDPLLPGERRLVQRRVKARHRGFFTLKRVLIRGGDPAGLFYKTRPFDLPAEIMIYPETVRLSWMPVRIKNQIQLSTDGRPLGISGIGQEFFGVREYRHTDGFRYIHWKASAKQKKLMVREFEANSAMNVSLVLDASMKDTVDNDPESNFEFLVKTAASITDYLSGMYCGLSFITGFAGSRLFSVSGDAATVRNRIIEHLATVQPCVISLESMLDSGRGFFRPGSILYCLSMSESPALRKRLNGLFDRGVEVRWFYAPKTCFSVKLSAGMKEFTGIGMVGGDYSGVSPYVAARNHSISKMLSYG